MQTLPTRTVAAMVVVAGVTLAGSRGFEGRTPTGAVFVMTNDTDLRDPSRAGNQVAMYARHDNGVLTLLDYFDTRGQGSGPGTPFAGNSLGSSHSVQLTGGGRFLLVTNAGSDDLSVFRVGASGLELTDVEPTGDGSPNQRFPNSVAQYRDLVYVLNSAGEGSIAGFRLSDRGTLTPIPGSKRELDASQAYPPDTLTNPAQVAFTPDGKRLVVSIKDGIGDSATGPGRVLVFDIDRRSGQPSAAFTRNDVNMSGPFGFSFDRRGNVLLALAFGGPNLTGAAGSFHIDTLGHLIPITPAVPSGGDLCWLENNGRYAYGASFGSGIVASYAIGRDGSLVLLDGAAGVTDDPSGSTPLDLGISPDGRFLYNVLPGSGAVAAWRINRDGSLTKLGEFSGLPRTSDGGSPAGIAVM